MCTTRAQISVIVYKVLGEHWCCKALHGSTSAHFGAVSKLIAALCTCSFGFSDCVGMPVHVD